MIQFFKNNFCFFLIKMKQCRLLILLILLFKCKRVFAYKKYSYSEQVSLLKNMDAAYKWEFREDTRQTNK